MSGVKGNKNGRGAKGRSGRKSAYKEMADAKKLYALWTDPELAKEVIKRARSGKGSLEDIFISMGYKKNVKVLIEIFKKLYPDMSKVDLSSKGKTVSGIILLPVKRDSRGLASIELPEKKKNGR